MHVARLDANPVHGRQMPHGVAGVGVRDELRLRGGARGEVEQQRVAGPGGAAGPELSRPGERVRVRVPSGRRAPLRADRDPGPLARHRAELRQLGRVGDDVPDLASRDAVDEVGRLQQRRRRDDHRPELHRGQDDFPQRRHVAEHQQHPVPAPDPEAAQPVGHLPRPGRQLGKGQADVVPVVADDPQRGPVRVLGGDHVEPVERPVELVKLGPGELPPGGFVVVPVAKQQVPRGPEGGRRCGRVGHLPIVAAPRRERETVSVAHNCCCGG